jgi:DNA-binding transcriptional MerR regulator
MQQNVPDKRYFTIGEVSDLCQVRPHVLRYWEQEFPQLKPKRRGNRRYYSRSEVFLVCKIKKLLHEQGFTTSGARQKLEESSLATPLSIGKEDLQTLKTELEAIAALLKNPAD